MTLRRAAIATAVVALLGLAIAADLAYLHAQVAASSEYTSWCSINEVVNCNVVLASEYAYFLGLPVAVWAVLTYLGVGIAALVLPAIASAARRRQLVAALFAVAVWNVLFSLYLLYVSLYELGALCLLCSGLYVVNFGLLVTTALLYSAAQVAARGQRAWRGRLRVITATAGAAVLVLVALVGWKASQGAQVLTAAEIKERDPGFYAWYTNLPAAPGETSGGHIKGQADAAVTLVEFSDFECGHCANAYRSLKQILPRYQKDVQVRFHHFPLDAACNPAVKHSVHQYACLAAMAAECAGAQGRFWEYHDVLFDNQSRLDRDSLLAYAERLGLDRAAFLACLDSEAPRQAIARDVADGMRLGIESTPTIYLNGRTITGMPRADALGYAIQLERAKQRGEG
jgi:protein-disulfide isomerase